MKACSDGRKADRAAYVAAQAAALKKALQAKATAEQNYSNLANKVDSDEQKARDAAMAAADRYIASHRVRSQAVAGSTGPASRAATNNASQGGNGPGETPELAPDAVVVTADDIRICTENTTRLDAVHDWALGLEKASATPPAR